MIGEKDEKIKTQKALGDAGAALMHQSGHSGGQCTGGEQKIPGNGSLQKIPEQQRQQRQL